jgi:hypothetical protein
MRHMSGPVTMSDGSAYAGQAALTLVESLILHLREAQQLSADDVAEIFRDAIEVHRGADSRFDSDHGRVVQLLENVETGCNGAAGETSATRSTRPAPLQPRQQPVGRLNSVKAALLVRHLEDVLAHAAEAGMPFTIYRIEAALETARAEAERGE